MKSIQFGVYEISNGEIGLGIVSNRTDEGLFIQIGLIFFYIDIEV